MRMRLRLRLILRGNVLLELSHVLQNREGNADVLRYPNFNHSITSLLQIQYNLRQVHFVAKAALRKWGLHVADCIAHSFFPAFHGIPV